MSLFRRRKVATRDTASPWFLDPNAVPAPGTEGFVWTGANVNTESALRISAVWACVSLIASSIASLPLDAYRRATDARVEVKPRPRLLDRPHPDIATIDWLTQVVMSLLLRGNAWLLVVDVDSLGHPTALLPLDPALVQVRHDGTVTIGGKEVQPGDLRHIRGLSWPGKVEGLSVISYARQTLGLSLATEEFGARFFSEGTQPSGVLSTEEDVSPEDGKAMLDAWESSHSRRSRRPALLTSGITWTPMSITPEESQFLETRRFSVEDVARLFGVPPHMIGAVDKSTSWGTGIEQQTHGFVTYTLRPWLTRLESALTDMLPRPQFVRFNLGALLRGTATERYTAYQMAVDTGWLQIDEIRALEDLPPLPKPPAVEPPPNEEAPAPDDEPTSPVE